MKVLNDLKNEQGFSLIEVAIALVITGILITASVPFFKNLIHWQQVNETKKKQDIILEAVKQFAWQNNYIPLPADPTVTGPEFGKSRTIINQEIDRLGIVPFQTLGLPHSCALDGFKRYFTYAGGESAMHRDSVQRNRSSNSSNFPITVYEKLSPSHPPLERGGSSDFKEYEIKVVILSHGDSGFGAYFGEVGHIRQVSNNGPASYKKKMNAGPSLKFYIRPYSNNPKDYFDDIIQWKNQLDIFPQSKQSLEPTLMKDGRENQDFPQISIPFKITATRQS